jgi:hypothetical protein
LKPRILQIYRATVAVTTIDAVDINTSSVVTADRIVSHTDIVSDSASIGTLRVSECDQFVYHHG